MTELSNLPPIDLELASYDVEKFDINEWISHWETSEYVEYFLRNRADKTALFSPELQLEQEGVKKLFVMKIAKDIRLP
jgi:hypothetical protein